MLYCMFPLPCNFVGDRQVVQCFLPSSAVCQIDAIKGSHDGVIRRDLEGSNIPALKRIVGVLRSLRSEPFTQSLHGIECQRVIRKRFQDVLAPPGNICRTDRGLPGRFTFFKDRIFHVKVVTLDETFIEGMSVAIIEWAELVAKSAALAIDDSRGDIGR